MRLEFFRHSPRRTREVQRNRAARGALTHAPNITRVRGVCDPTPGFERNMIRGPIMADTRARIDYRRPLDDPMGRFPAGSEVRRRHIRPRAAAPRRLSAKGADADPRIGLELRVDGSLVRSCEVCREPHDPRGLVAQSRIELAERGTNGASRSRLIAAFTAALPRDRDASRSGGLLRR